MLRTVAVAGLRLTVRRTVPMPTTATATATAAVVHHVRHTHASAAAMGADLQLSKRGQELAVGGGAAAAVWESVNALVGSGSVGGLIIGLIIAHAGMSANHECAFQYPLHCSFASRSSSGVLSCSHCRARC